MPDDRIVMETWFEGSRKKLYNILMRAKKRGMRPLETNIRLVPPRIFIIKRNKDFLNIWVIYNIEILVKNYLFGVSAFSPRFISEKGKVKKLRSLENPEQKCILE
jgi:hypothetical protein